MMPLHNGLKRIFILTGIITAFLIMVHAAYSIPLLDNEKLTTSIKASIASTIKGKFGPPIWSSTGSSFLCGGEWIELSEGQLREKENFELDQTLDPFGWVPEDGKIYLLKDENGNNDISIYDISRKTQKQITLPVRKNSKKIRILDPVLTGSGEILAVFQRAAGEKDVKDCYLFTMDREGKSFKQRSDNSIHTVKAKFLMMGSQIAYGKLRFPCMSRDGARIACLSLTDPSPEKLTYDLCIFSREKGNGRAVLSGLSHPGPPAWAPDGSTLAVKCRGEQGGAEVVIATSSGEIIARIPAGPTEEKGFMDRVSWSFDGECVAYSSGNGDSIVISPKNGGSQYVVSQLKQTEEKNNTDFLRFPCFSPSELNLVYVQNSMMKNEVMSLLYLARISR